MNKLEEQFPNFNKAISSIKADSDLRLVKSDESEIKYKMSLMAFNNKLGDIYITLRGIKNNETAIGLLTFTTLSGNEVKASTQSEYIQKDISEDKWIEIINETMIKHNYNPDHQKVALSFMHKRLSNSTNQNSGCVLTLIGLSIIIFLVYNII